MSSMTTAKALRSRLSVAFAVVTLMSVAARSAPTTCRQVFHPEVRARVEIANPRLAKNEFTVSRGLDNYNSHFPVTHTEGVRAAILGLERGSVWVDMGAGEGRALDDGLRLNGGLEGVGIAYKKPERAHDGADLGSRYRYLEGDFVENMARDGKLEDLNQRVDLMTDVYGPLSYSEHLPELLQTYLDLLQPGGRLYATFMSERNYEPHTTAPGETLFAVNVVRRNGRIVPDGLVHWLRSIPGIELLEVVDVKTNYSVKEHSRAFVLRKTHATVTVPRNLTTVFYRESSPPERHFEITNQH